MNDSPGWTPPGSSPSDRPSDDKGHTTPGGASQQPPGQPPHHWAAQQPPAAEGQGWGAAPPPPPGQYGRPGWGNWSASWQQAPVAAKPGVVPLRPLGVVEILDGAVSTMRAHWRTVLGISLAVAVVTQLVGTLVTGIWLQDSSSLDALSTDPDPTFDEVLNATSGALGSSAVASVVSVLGSVIATAMLTVVVSRAVLGRRVSTGEAWQDSRPQLLRLLGLLIVVPLLVTLAVLIGSGPGIALLAAGATAPGVALTVLGLLAGTVAGVWLWVRYSLSAPALMLEKQGVGTAMRRSAKLVRGSWWRVFGIQALAYIVVLFFASIIQMPTSVIGLLVSGEGTSALTGTAPTTSWTFLIISAVGGVVASTVTLPVSAGVTALLYLDQRIRREALDIELARAAGVPGYGDQHTDRPSSGS